MPTNEIDAREREAYELSELIHSAGRVVETAIKTEDPASKKALRDAAKTLLQNAIARMDESVATSLADEED